MNENPLQRRVNIDISMARPQSGRQSLPRLVVIGVVPYDYPIISEVSPGSNIRRSPYNHGEPYVEHVRLSSVAQTRLLPGIDHGHPSRLKDSVKSILDMGCNEVDCILVRGIGLKPWDLTAQPVMELVMGYFTEIPGAMIVFPDAGGPWPRSWQGVPSEEIQAEQARNLIDAVRIYGPNFADNFQLGFMDMIPLSESATHNLINSVQGYDMSLCCWTGSFDAMRTHGWRSSAAFTAGYINKRVDVVTQSLMGHEIPMVGGRKIISNRARLLGGQERVLQSTDLLDNCVVLSIHESGRYAQVLSEYTLRRPRYEWSIPVVRTVKAIHQSLRQAADMFVFRPVKEVEAIALEKTVEMILNPFYERGILVGAEGTGRPSVTGEALPSHTQPMLSVNLSAMVRPWCQNISLKVMVKSGSDPVIQDV